MVVRSERDPEQIFEELLERDILIRDVSGYPMLAVTISASVWVRLTRRTICLMQR